MSSFIGQGNDEIWTKWITVNSSLWLNIPQNLVYLSYIHIDQGVNYLSIT